LDRGHTSRGRRRYRATPCLGWCPAVFGNYWRPLSGNKLPRMCQLSDTFHSPRLGMVSFSDVVRDTLLGYRQPPGVHEAGGILLGRVVPDTQVLIDVATVPNAHDQSGPYFFDRAKAPAQARVEAAWYSSDGEHIYLGEWHTHPETNPTPSGRDRTMIRNMLMQSQMEIDFLLLVIVGSAMIWVGEQRSGRLYRLACTSGGIVVHP
jgi:integrative and conjugative element protein (TIGR02256 family)